MLRITTDDSVSVLEAPAAPHTSRKPRRQAEPADHRRHPRLALPFMYTLVRARPEGDDRYRWTGHVYDLSASGARFELDRPVPTGTRLEIRMVLPGDTQAIVSAAGHVVRLHDEDAEPGPTRMALTFDRLAPADRARLQAYLQPRLDLRTAA